MSPPVENAVCGAGFAAKLHVARYARGGIGDEAELARVGRDVRDAADETFRHGYDSPPLHAREGTAPEAQYARIARRRSS